MRPDEFVEQGGGDCEDWALFTAGLLQFWNYDAYVGSFNFKKSYHAVTLVKVDALPFGFKGYEITDARLDEGEPLPRGVYTVIDYYRVGGLTLASGRRPVLVRISRPEWYYGREM